MSPIVLAAIRRYREQGLTLHGQYRLRLFNQNEMQRLLSFDIPREEALEQCIEFDTGPCKNVVTDFGRRYLIQNPWSSGAFNLFIAQCSNPGIVRRTSLQFVYAVQSPSQVRVPDTSTNSLSLLTQTRIVEFPAPSASRTINTVGLTPNTLTTGENAIHAIVAYSKLSAPVTQGTSNAADLSYTITWSLT